MAAEERDELVLFDEETEISWLQYFEDFKRTAWPMLAAQGFTFPQALLFWRQEQVLSQLVGVNTALNKE